jgi:DNA repair exonuclease SbcCD ATPase subunit|tara:strand:+ start:185 stop:1312 length:1128 start_codon:yes stop_codon:yes gene_type:complete
MKIVLLKKNSLSAIENTENKLKEKHSLDDNFETIDTKINELKSNEDEKKTILNSLEKTFHNSAENLMEKILRVILFLSIVVAVYQYIETKSIVGAVIMGVIWYYLLKYIIQKVMENINLKAITGVSESEANDIDKYNAVSEELKKLNKKIEKEENLKKDLDNKIKIISNEIEYLEHKNQIIQSVISLNKVYDSDDNNELDVAEAKSVELILKEKQKEIRVIEKQEGRDYLKDLSKINIFLNSYQKQLVQDYNDIQIMCDLEDLTSISIANEKISNFENDLNIYKVLLSSLVLMISNLVNDNLIDFYKLRDIFDKLSIFESNYEKKVILQLRTNNNLTSQLIDVTNRSRNEIVTALGDVGYEIESLKFDLKWMSKT